MKTHEYHLGRNGGRPQKSPPNPKKIAGQWFKVMGEACPLWGYFILKYYKSNVQPYGFLL